GRAGPPAGQHRADRRGGRDGERARFDPRGPRHRLPGADGRLPGGEGAPVRQRGAAGPQARTCHGDRDGPGRGTPSGSGSSAPVGRTRGSGGNSMTALVGVVMGSDSDWPVMSAAVDALAEFDIETEVDVVSAHRMPEEMLRYGQEADSRGLRVIIAGAGGAAHLPGMLAAVTPLPVIGVPVPLAHLDGMDSLLSIVRMPAWVTVATGSVDRTRY